MPCRSCQRIQMELATQKEEVYYAWVYDLLALTLKRHKHDS